MQLIKDKDTSNPTQEDIIVKANLMISYINDIPQDIQLAIQTRHKYEYKEGMQVYIQRGIKYIPAIYDKKRGARHWVYLVWIDNVGNGHTTMEPKRIDDGKLIPAGIWKRSETDIRWIGPINNCYPGYTKWKIGNTILEIEIMHIKELTRAIQYSKMKKPACEVAWEIRLNIQIPWNIIWKIKCWWVSARDQITWLKLQHRNLYVAKSDPNIQDKKCKAFGCNEEESMLHLASCKIIQDNFWFKIIDLMRRMNLRAAFNIPFIILGLLENNKTVSKVSSGFLFLGWRVLYAEVVNCRINDKPLNLAKAYKRLVTMVISRVKAYGQKWYRWYTRIRNIQKKKSKTIPQKYQKRIIISSKKDGTYTLNSILLNELATLKQRDTPPQAT